MPTPKSFEPVDAMDVRSQMGNLLDKVEFTKQRFIIQRRGKPKALLVPVLDQSLIQDHIDGKNRELEIIYSGFEGLRGVIDDPHGQNASATIDDYVYGNASAKPAQGDNDE